jgi:hypothetical protein
MARCRSLPRNVNFKSEIEHKNLEAVTGVNLVK